MHNPVLGRCIAKLGELLSKEWFNKLAQIVFYIYDPLDDVHGLPHVLRVLCLSLYLADKLDSSNADLEVIAAAALLHDVGRRLEEVENTHHAILSSRLAELILKQIGFPNQKIRKTMEAITSHSFSLGIRPNSIEACIVSDADKIDALGAIGVYRAIIEGYRTKRGIKGTIEHYHVKLKQLIRHLCTDEAKQIASDRLKLMNEFFNSLSTDVRISEEISKIFSMSAKRGKDEV